MNHPLLYLPSVENTNTWAREHLERFGDLGAVYTTSQTAGRGRRGHTWVNAAGQALYYSCVVQQPLVQPETLPLLSCLVTAKVLHGVYGIDCRIKWPNDLLLNGKKIVGILCEGVPDKGAWILGIGINLAQPQSYFDAAGPAPRGQSAHQRGEGLRRAGRRRAGRRADRAGIFRRHAPLCPGGHRAVSGRLPPPTASTWAAM